MSYNEIYSILQPNEEKSTDSTSGQSNSDNSNSILPNSGPAFSSAIIHYRKSLLDIGPSINSDFTGYLFSYS